MTNDELANALNIVSIKLVFNTSFIPIVKFVFKDGSYELFDFYKETIWRTDNPSRDYLINEYLSNKLFLMYEKRIDKIDKILNDG